MKKIKYIVAGVLLVVLDQFFKLWVLSSLKPIGSYKIIESLFYLTYVENRGAAFGILQGHITLLSGLTFLVLVAVLALFFNGAFKGRVLQWSVIAGVSGGVGNLIDRVFRGYVVDYLDFSSLFGFPVFNFADILVVCGTLSVLLCILLYDDKKTAREGKAAGGPAEEENTPPDIEQKEV